MFGFQPQLLRMLKCGVLLLAWARTAEADVVVFSDDFDPITAGQWTLSSDVGARGAGSAGFDFGNALHFRGDGTRSAVTDAVDLTINTAARVEFDFRGGNEDVDGTTLWEDTDGGEDAVVEYTIDGVDFVTVANLDLFQFRNDTPTTEWLFASVELPAAAITASTEIRFRQLSHSDSTRWDHWAVDNVQIISSPEPSGFMLILVAGVAVLLVHRRRRRDAFSSTGMRSVGQMESSDTFSRVDPPGETLGGQISALPCRAAVEANNRAPNRGGLNDAERPDRPNL